MTDKPKSTLENLGDLYFEEVDAKSENLSDGIEKLSNRDLSRRLKDEAIQTLNLATDEAAKAVESLFDPNLKFENSTDRATLASEFLRVVDEIGKIKNSADTKNEATYLRQIAALKILGLSIEKGKEKYASRSAIAVAGEYTEKFFVWLKDKVGPESAHAAVAPAEVVEKGEVQKWVRDFRREAARAAEEIELKFEVREMSEEIEKKYGFEISYSTQIDQKVGDAMSLQEFPGYRCEQAEVLDVKKGLQDLERLLSKYPVEVIRHSKLNKIYLFNSVTNERGKGVKGSRRWNRLLIDLKNGVGSCFDHELHHQLDSVDDLEADNLPFVKGVYFGLDLKNIYYSLDNRPPKDRKVFAHEPEKPVGFVNLYAKLCGPEEDQAMTAEALLRPRDANELFERAVFDIILRKKMEMITGYIFDPNQKKFIERKISSEGRWQRAGFEGPQFYEKWFDGKNSSKFWNAIAAGEPMRLS